MTVNIYRIYSHIGDLQYFGSTTRTILHRYKSHVQKYNTKINMCTSNVLFDAYGTVNTFVELLEVCDVDERTEREAWWIRNNECVNKHIPGQTCDEYYEANRNAICAKVNAYREENKEEIDEKKRKYYQRKQDELKQRSNAYYHNNHDAIIIRRKELREVNKERDKAWREQNKDARNARRRELRALKKSKSED
jgi:hypothetical protein